MATDIVMPRLSDSMEEGTVLKWMKAVGDEVALGEELVEIETDKANMVFEADAAGTLIEIVAAEGETLPIGDVIARVGEAAEAAPAPVAATDGQASRNGLPPPRMRRPISPPAQPPRPSLTRARSSLARDNGGDGRVKASPIARRIAREKGIDLSSLQGSGPGGRIIKADVEKAPAASGVAPTDDPRRSQDRPSGPHPAPASPLRRRREASRSSS